MRAAAAIALAALAACQTAPQPRMSLAEAEALCTERATRYAETPLPVRGENGYINLGLQAETPDSFMVRDFYRSCVRANAGVWPRSVPDIPVYN